VLVVIRGTSRQEQASETTSGSRPLTQSGVGTTSAYDAEMCRFTTVVVRVVTVIASAVFVMVLVVIVISLRVTVGTVTDTVVTVLVPIIVGVLMVTPLITVTVWRTVVGCIPR
jgi:hypothetical protein